MHNDGSINTNWLTIGHWKILCQPIWHRRIKPILSIDLHRIVVHGRTKKKTSTLPCYATKNHPCPTSMGWKFAPSHPNLGSSQRLPQSRRHRRHAAHSAATAAVVVGPHDALAPLVGKAQQATGQIAKAWALTLGFVWLLKLWSHEEFQWVY